MSDRLKGDRQFIWELMEHKKYAYWCASDEIQADIIFQARGLAVSDCFASLYVRKCRKNEAGLLQLQTTTSRLQNDIELFEPNVHVDDSCWHFLAS